MLTQMCRVALVGSCFNKLILPERRIRRKEGGVHDNDNDPFHG